MDTTISALPAADPIFGNEILPMVQAATTLQTQGARLQLGLGSPDATTLLSRFGDGSDGAVVVNAAVNLVRDMYYDTLTMVAGGSIQTNGFRIFVRDTLDITAADADCIGRDSNPGNNAAGAVAGTGGTVVAAAAVGGGQAGGNGSAGSTGNAGQPSSVSAPSPANGGRGASSVSTYGKGGNGLTGTGGTARTSSSPSNVLPFWRIFPELLRGGTLILGGGGGTGGSGGGGDGVNAGGGGGGGGSGGAVLFLAARKINRGAGTAVGALCVRGGAGGNGANGVAGDTGGGGGGNGGGGGWIYLLYEELLGTVAEGAVCASGGNGGNAGAGVGAGLSGTGGQGGAGGRVTTINTLTGDVVVNSLTTTMGGPPTGTAGGIGYLLRNNL